MTDPHISTKDKPGDYDAIETAKPGEPLFPLQGGDPLAPATVLFWVAEARDRAVKKLEGKARDELLRKASMAEQVAWAMSEYQSGQQAQPGVRASYADEGVSDAPDLSDRVKIRKALIDAVARLHNAAAIVKEIEEFLAGLGDDQDEARLPLLTAIDTINAVADHIEPRRGNERS